MVLNIDIQTCNDEQLWVMKYVFFNNSNLCIVGPAGTGKSFIIKKLVELFIKNQIEYQILTPTGVSAANIDGRTLHSYFSISSQTLKVRNNKSIYILDEISMIDSALFDRLASAFKKSRLILFGDFQQLKPINGEFITNAKTWPNYNFKEITLSKIFRQSDKGFIDILSKIRIHNELYLLNAFAKKEIDFDTTGYTFLFGTNQEKNNFNNQKLTELKNQKIYEFEATPLPLTNNNDYNDVLKIMPLVISLKIGCRVMCVKNMTIDNVYIYNGCLGTIFDITPKGVVVIFDQYSNKKIVIQVQKIPIQDNGTTWYYQQIPLTIGWAFTVHKVQGITLDKVIIDCKNFNDPRILYVACSRVKTPERLVLLNYDSTSF
jgi:ATP-dependent exoDNAse (exonuclease V) alpha subunit